MRSVLLMTILLVIAFVLSGCATVGEKVDPTRIAMAYYNQNRTYEPVRIEGLTEVTLRAAEGETLAVVLTSQLDPLSIYPRDPSTLKTLLEGLTSLGTVVGASLVGLEMVDGLSQGPTIVEQPAPIIIGAD